MPTHSNSTNQQSGENHGAPAGEGQPKAAGNKPVGREPERLDLADEFTEDGADQATTPELRHPNRNTDKPQLDKPSYGGGH